MSASTAVPPELVEDVVRRTRLIAAIPAPPLGEQNRAALVAGWWREITTDVRVDVLHNVWAMLRRGSGGAIVVAAHLDTVFGPEVAHGVVERSGLLWGPSVGDDSVAVAALGALDSLLPDDVGRPVWLLATIGEEGVGNLAGIRHALATAPTEIAAVVALEGNWLGRVCVTGVGSLRYRVELTGPGGHAWEAAEVDSAVHAAARIVAALDRAERPAGGRSSVNVGRIEGGQAINVRAPSASFDVDLRAETAAGLAELADMFHHVVEAHRGDLAATCEVFGERPAGQLDPTHPLALAAIDALALVGFEATLTAASTDANAVHAAGIPAIAIGITVGAGEHTTEEWIDPSQIDKGLLALAETITGYVRRTS